MDRCILCGIPLFYDIGVYCRVSPNVEGYICEMCAKCSKCEYRCQDDCELCLLPSECNPEIMRQRKN